MRIFFETDLEGAVGVYSNEMCFGGDPLLDYAYAELAKDINAAIAGALEADPACECYVTDGHGVQGLNWDKVDPRAIHGRCDCRDPYDIMFCIGCHAQIGTQNAFLDHTQSSKSWFRYSVNGRPTGELGQSAMMAAAVGAPVVLVTGDEAAVREAHDFFGEVETVAVKRGIGRQQCEMYDPAVSRQRIREAAKRAVENWQSGAKQYRLYTPALPAVCELIFMRTDYCDAAAQNPRVERIDARTIRWIAPTYYDILP